MNSFVFTSSLSLFLARLPVWHYVADVLAPEAGQTCDVTRLPLIYGRQHIGSDTELLYGKPVVEEYNTHRSRFEIHGECGRT
jgi:hypothetical protein